MRVAHLLRKYNPLEWGGTESAMLQLTTAMANGGVESVVYAPRPACGAASADPLADAGCAMRQFRAFVPVWGISPEHRSQMIAVGGNLISFDLIGSLWREKGVDLIHSHALGRLGAIGRVVAQSRGLPFVISVHGGVYDLPAALHRELRGRAAGGWDWGRPLGLMLRARRLLDQADAIITLNPREAALIGQRHPGRRVLLESHGVPTALFARDCRKAAIEAFPVVGDRPVLLTLGRIDPVKNQDWLVARAADVARRHPGALLLFVGACTDRKYGDSLRARVASEGLQDSVMLLGNLPFGDPRLVGLMQRAQAVVVPSKSESFGMVILESWAAGKPVISSRTSGAKKLIEDGVNGLLFDLERPETFHSAVDRVLTQRELAAQWGQAGRAKTVAEFDTSVCAGRMRRLYESLIEEKNALRHNS